MDCVHVYRYSWYRILTGTVLISDSRTTVTEGVFDITTDTVQAVTAWACLLTRMTVGGPDENTLKMK